MTTYIKRLQASGIHGRFDIDLTFRDQTNIVYGKNGTGKTTLLHILANVLQEDYERFACILFDQIQVELSQGQTFSIVAKNRRKVGDHFHTDIYVNGQLACGNVGPLTIDEAHNNRTIDEAHNNRMKRLKSGQLSFLEEKPIAYFPAFRSMIEAWATTITEYGRFDDPPSKYRMRRRIRMAEEDSTSLARRLFGGFIPSLDYPSIPEIEARLAAQIRQAVMEIARADRDQLMQASTNILNRLAQEDAYTTEDIKKLLQQTDDLLKKLQEYPIQSKLGPNLRQSVDAILSKRKNEQIAALVLEVYYQAIEQIINLQTKSFATIERYLESVNIFLEDKQLKISATSRPGLMLQFNDGSDSPPQIGPALSSGERQILTLLYAATQMGQKEVVLVDEPEISLHVDWQRELIKQMSKQLGQRQIIVCTHSPVIGADFDDDEIIMVEPISIKRNISSQSR